MAFFKWLKEKREEKKQRKYKQALKKTSLVFSKDIKKLASKHKEYDDEYVEELENILISTDMGMKMVLKLVDLVGKKIEKGKSLSKIKEILEEAIIEIYDGKKYDSDLNIKDKRLNVIMMVGVNGAGKTTTIAKIANLIKQQNLKVLLVAGDTFRAGAVDQLDKWAQRLEVTIVKPVKDGQDPASVIYDGILKAKEEKYDVLLIDTAGRLQNKVNLMNELEKVSRIIKREIKDAPHETLLVIDAVTGQNGVSQAKNFSDVTDVTGIVLTKMDGTAKGGVILSIKEQLDIPVKLLGVGEQIDDIEQFDIEEYVYNLMSEMQV